jgi:hypothetical protein
MQLAGENKIKLSPTFDGIVKVGTISISSIRDAGTIVWSIVSVKHSGGVEPEAGPEILSPQDQSKR